MCFAPLVDDILVNKQNAQHTIIFCCQSNMFINVSKYFWMQLKLDLYYPPTVPHLPKYRLVDMFTSMTAGESVKMNIMRTYLT